MGTNQTTNQLSFRKGISVARKKIIQLRHQHVLAARTKFIEKALKPLGQIDKRAKKEYLALVSKDELKAAATMAENLQLEIARIYLSHKVRSSKKAVQYSRKKFRTAFKRNFKNSSAILQLRKKYLGELADGDKQIDKSYSVLDGLVGLIPDILSLPPLFFISFKPPFAFGETFQAGFTNHVTRDNSFTDLQTGFIINDFDFKHHGGGSFNPVVIYENYVGVGFSFTMPETGVLKITVNMQCTLSLLQASIKDNFGWSEGNVRMSAGVYMNVLHPNNLVMSIKPSLSFLSLSSDGDDVSTFVDDMQSLTPYQFVMMSTGAFAQGETVPIILGSMVHVRSHLDDMTCRLTGRVGWQVKEVFVEVI